MKALIIFCENYDKEVAIAIAKGIGEAGGSASILSAKQAIEGKIKLDFYDVIFLGFTNRLFSISKDFGSFLNLMDLKEKKIAVFYAKAMPWKNKAEEAIAAIEKKGARVLNSIGINVKGALAPLGIGKIEQIDIIRAQAFGERVTNYAMGKRVTKVSEKASIKGYKK